MQVLSRWCQPHLPLREYSEWAKVEKNSTWHVLGVGPGKPTWAASGKKGSDGVTVAPGGGKTAVEVEPAKEDAGPA